MSDKKTRQQNMIILIAIFIIGTLLHYFYGEFSKSIDVLPDELRYYDIAKSIFSGNGLTLRSVPSDYQKMGYTLFLVPFFIIKNGIVRIKSITFCNSLLMMSSVFPMYGIMNRLNISRRIKMVFLAAFVVFPDLMYSATFMAEVMYWPILLLFIYLFMVNRERQSLILSILLGVLGYIGYSTKEIFLAVLLSVVLFELLFPISEHLFNKKSEGARLRDNYSKKRFLLLIATVLSFAAVYFIVKLIFFRGMGNSYDQMDIDAIASPETFGYMIYGFFYYLAAIVIACFVVPLISPGMVYRTMKTPARELYIYNIFSILMSVATIAYTITVREDYGDIIPRLHFRYLGPLIIIALIVFLYCISDEEIVFKPKKSYIITIVVTLFISFGLFRGVTVITGVDQFILNWVYSFTEAIDGFLGLFIVEAIIVIAVVVSFVLLIRNKKTFVFVLMTVLMCVLGIFNSVTAKDRLLDYMYRDEALVDEAVRLNEFVDTVDGAVLYVGEHKSYSDYCKCIDTYIDRSSDFYYVSRNGLSKVGEGIYNVKELTVPVQLNLWKMKYSDMNNIEYVIEDVENDEDFGVTINNLTLVPELSKTYYKVYKNNNSDVLVIGKKGDSQ